jgi:hypothetical protein
MPFWGRGEGQDKRRGLPQDRVLFLAAESRPFIAEAKAYEETLVTETGFQPKETCNN